VLQHVVKVLGANGEGGLVTALDGCEMDSKVVQGLPGRGRNFKDVVCLVRELLHQLTRHPLIKLAARFQGLQSRLNIDRRWFLDFLTGRGKQSWHGLHPGQDGYPFFLHRNMR